jgi:hypothetical protein
MGLYLQRCVDRELDDMLPAFPAFMLVGPRACGKTTTAARRAASQLRLDRPEQAAVVAADSDVALLAGEPAARRSSIGCARRPTSLLESLMISERVPRPCASAQIENELDLVAPEHRQLGPDHRAGR